MMKWRLLIVGLLIVAGISSGTVAASADEGDPPFLCPIVGDGVNNADDHNGSNGVSTINPPAGTSFLPGNNQAGAKSNTNAHNTSGPGDANAGPGGNPDFSPIWPAS